LDKPELSENTKVAYTVGYSLQVFSVGILILFYFSLSGLHEKVCQGPGSHLPVHHGSVVGFSSHKSRWGACWASCAWARRHGRQVKVCVRHNVAFTTSLTSCFNFLRTLRYYTEIIQKLRKKKYAFSWQVCTLRALFGYTSLPYFLSVNNTVSLKNVTDFHLW